MHQSQDHEELPPQPPLCERCNKRKKRRGKRYCSSCEAIIRLEMAASDYLTEDASDVYIR